jgi:hypothetical protein
MEKTRQHPHPANPLFPREAIARRPLTAAFLLGGLALWAAPAQSADAPQSRVNALVDFEFANEYVTPRGMIVTDEGLTFQPLVLAFVNIYKAEGFLNDVTLIPGVWNDFCGSPVSKTGPTYRTPPTTAWVEIDPIAGVEFGFAKRFKFDMTYTAFNMQVLGIPTSQHLDNKISFDDTDYLKKFALHPYFEFWQELDNKATDADLPAFPGKTVNPGAKHPSPGSSYYLEVGIDPGYTFEGVGGLKLEAPCRVLLPDDRFYGDLYAKSSTVGLYEVGLKATLPLKFMPEGYGHWGVHAGVKYLHFVDDNLYNLNAYNAPGKSTRDTVQVYCGISTFF